MSRLTCALSGVTYVLDSDTPLSATTGVGAWARLGGAAPSPCYDSAAVLGGELAVPCTCNPL